MDITTQERFKTLTETMKAKIRLVADYMAKEMDQFAMIELEQLDHYLDKQLDNILELIPDSKQV